MKIGVLAAGIPPDELINEHGSYADMTVRLLQQSSNQFECEIFDVRLNQFPDSLSGFDGWVITGSKNNVSENLPWMIQLKNLIIEAKEIDQPMLGICFGHQIIADALGGKVGRYEGGWGLGEHQYNIVADVGLNENVIRLNAVHQDQVVEKPLEAECWASSDFCINAGLKYGDFAMTIQAHPEFSKHYEMDLILNKKGEVFPVVLADATLKDLKSSADENQSSEVGKIFAAFLLDNKS
jgi:GMP synthase-like glutamine amidotransferase